MMRRGRELMCRPRPAGLTLGGSGFKVTLTTRGQIRTWPPCTAPIYGSIPTCPISRYKITSSVRTLRETRMAVNQVVKRSSR